MHAGQRRNLQTIAVLGPETNLIKYNCYFNDPSIVSERRLDQSVMYKKGSITVSEH